MRFRHCTPKIALALPVLGALMTPTLALPDPKNRYHSDKLFPSEVIRERVKNPFYRYAEVPVELKEGTAVPEPALISKHQFDDDEIIDRAYNREVQPHHGVASATKGRYSASGNAETEQDEGFYEIEDIAQIEKRDLFSEDEFEDRSGETGGKRRERDERRERCKHLKEAKAHAFSHKHVAEPAPPVKPHEPIPDHFDEYVEVPTTPKNTTTIEDAPVTTADAPEHEAPVDLLPEALTDAEEEDPKKHIERRTMHRLTPLDIEAEEPAPAAVPGATATQAQAPASLPKATYTNTTLITNAGHVHISRPIIQH